MTVGQNELRSFPRSLPLCRFLPVMHARPRGALVLLTLIAVLMTSVLATPASAGQRVALVIGNASYAHAPSLANPLNDANDIGTALERLGFSVTRLPNASRAELWDGLQKFRLAASASEVAVVFYAGHGIEVDKRNFLIPVDARLVGDGDVEFEAVSLDLVLRAVEGASNFRLIILDACRDNPFAVAMRRAGATRSIGRGLASVEPPGETLVAYAAKEGMVAADGEGRNSPYTTALLTHLEEPGLDVGLMFRKVRDAVLAKTGGHQEPFWYGSLSSEGAYLAALPEPEEPTPIVEDGSDNPKPGPVSPGNDRRLTAEELAAERVFWESVKDSTHVADFEAYLKQFPGGTYEALARNRLARLTEQPDEKPDVQVAVTPDEPEPVVSPEPSAPAPEAVEATLELNRQERRQIQMGLASLGFDPGPADGLFGQRTRNAIGSWQESQGTTATGHLDAEAAKTLMVAGEAKDAIHKTVLETLSRALPAVERIEDADNQSRAFAWIAKLTADAGAPPNADPLLSKALRQAKGADEGYGRDWAFHEIALVQAHFGAIRDALTSADWIDDGDLLVQTLLEIAEIQAKAGDQRSAQQFVSKALDAVRSLEDAYNRSSGFRSIAKFLADAGDVRSAASAISKAMDAARNVEKPWYRSLSFAWAVELLSDIGDISGVEMSLSNARSSADKITDSYWKSGAYSTIATYRVRLGDTEAADKTFFTALSIAEEIKDEFYRDAAIMEIVTDMSENEQFQQALTTAERIRKMKRRAITFSEIAVAQAETGNLRKARNSLSKAQRIAAGNEGVDDWNDTFRSIARAQAAIGNFSNAVRTANEIEDQHQRSWTFSAISIAQAKSGMIAEALETVERVIDDKSYVDALLEIARSQLGEGG